MNLKFSLWLCIGMAMALFVSNEGIAADTAKIAFERVNLVDGRGGPVQPEMTVIVQDGRFTVVRPAALV